MIIWEIVIPSIAVSYAIIAHIVYTRLEYTRPRLRMLWSIFWPARSVHFVCMTVARIVHAILHDEDLE